MLITKKIFLVLMIAFVAIFLFLPRTVFAQVVINEFSSGTTSDWVELYNAGTESAQLLNLRIRDSTTNKKDLSGELGAGGFQVVTFSKWLNNDGDVVKLIRLDGESEQVLEEISYGTAGGLCAPGGNGSIGRFPDGSSTIIRFIVATQNASNNTAQDDPCPTPTPTEEPKEEPRPTPTSTPGPTNTPTPKISTPTPNPTKKPTPTSTPASVSILASDSTGQILGGIATVASEQSLPTPEVLGATTRNFSGLLPKVLIGAGFLFLLVSGFFLLLPKIKGYNRFRGKKGEKDEESSDIG